MLVFVIHSFLFYVVLSLEWVLSCSAGMLVVVPVFLVIVKLSILPLYSLPWEFNLGSHHWAISNQCPPVDHHQLGEGV